MTGHLVSSPKLDAPPGQPNGGAIELAPLPSTSTSAAAATTHKKPREKKNKPTGVLGAYEGLLREEKEKKKKQTLERVFGGGDGASENVMKFSHSIQFNAVPDWSSQYIAYSNLKKLIYTLEKEVNQRNQNVALDAEQSPLLESAAGDPDKVFTQSLDNELHKIVSFYHEKESEVFAEVDELIKEEGSLRAELLEVQQQQQQLGGEEADGSILGRRKTAPDPHPRKGSVFRDWNFPGRRRTSVSRPILDRIDSDDSDEETEEHSTTLKRTDSGKAPSLGGDSDAPSKRARRRTSMNIDDMTESMTAGAASSIVTIKKRVTNLYVSLCELKSYVQLNRTGFTKVLKKYDKILDRKLKQSYIENNIMQSSVFKQETTDTISEKITQVEQAYAELATHGDLDSAKRELRLDLREHVVWERNTVWREMIGIERKAQAANLGIRRTILGGDKDPSQRRRQGDEESETTKEVDTPVGRYRCPQFVLHSQFYVLIAILVVFLLLLVIPIMELPEQQNCLALVLFVSLLWATEAIPLFVTSLIVPFLAVVLRVVRREDPPHDRLGSKAAASYIFSAMWTPVIMLLLGGFTIAAALSKHNIAKMLATFVLSKAGTRPRNVLLTNMFVSMFASMWISNVAAPVLCFSIIQPILRSLPSDSPMIKSLLLGIALSANIGGAASPIASPQNLIALENMDPEPGWGVWFFISLPICIIIILLIWVLLLVTFQPGRSSTIVPIRPMKDKMTGTQWFIIGVTVGTIVLWCVTHQLEPVFGDMGVVAIIPLVLFFGTGILTKEDFNNFLWTIIILAAGGLALGKAVSSSGLLHTIASSITAGVADFSLYGVYLTFSVLILVVATFISHTVAALIILPLVAQVGAGMSEPHPNVLVMGSVILCSCAMGLPTSGFPNMTAVMMEDPSSGVRYLRVRDFLTRGIPSSVLSLAVVGTVGYGLMRIAGL
ncbi:MAG: low-affinity phosphate transporter [Alyxoria varia]|nr:MAG: low-affinity phosphate transporter [Alyxoria varia]